MERYLLSGIIDQPWTEKAWATEEVSASFAHARDFIAGWGAVMGIKDVSVERPSPEDFPFLHPGQSAVLSSPAGHLGWIGELHPEVAVAWEFGADKSPLVFEIDLEAAFAATKIGQSIDVVSRRFPPATRDLAFLVDRNTTHAAFDAAIRAFPKKQHLVRHSLFDVYEGKGCPEGKKSMAWAFRFQAADRTLNDKEVDGEISALIDWLQGKLSATLRQ
jgi:phenylalanyl-tRNA synthetase beta chain